jgi:WD40 repeat protein
MRRVVLFFAILSLSSWANAANLCSATILARISDLQARAEATQSRALFSALQTRIRLAKESGIDVSRIDAAKSQTAVREEARKIETKEKEAADALTTWKKSSWQGVIASQSAYSPNGKSIALFFETSIEIRNSKTGKLIANIPVDERFQKGSHLSFLGEKRVALRAASNRAGVAIFEIGGTNEPRIILSGENVRNIFPSGDGKFWITNIGDRWLQIDPKTGHPFRQATFTLSSQATTDSTGNRIASPGDELVKIYDFSGRYEASFEVEVSGTIRSVRLSPDGEYVLISADNLTLWHIDTHSMVKEFDTEGDPTLMAEFRDNGNLIVAISAPVSGIPFGIVRVLRTSDGKQLDEFKTPSGIYRNSVSPSGETISFRSEAEYFQFKYIGPGLK